MRFLKDSAARNGIPLSQTLLMRNVLAGGNLSAAGLVFAEVRLLSTRSLGGRGTTVSVGATLSDGILQKHIL